jgi:hypothetical protein
MRFLTHTCRLRLPVTVVVVVVRLGALLVVVVAVPEAMLGSFAKAGHTMAIAKTLAMAGGVMKTPFFSWGTKKMMYFHHHSPENTGRSSEKSVGTFTWRVQPACRSWPILVAIH